MSTPEFIIIVLLCICIILIGIFSLLIYKKISKRTEGKEELLAVKQDILNQIHSLSSSLTTLFTSLNEFSTKAQNDRIELLVNSVNQSNLQNEVRMENIRKTLETSLSNINLQTEQKLENMRKTIESSLGKLQDENSKKLDEMRNVVDEKLQKTLEDRLSKSFEMVSKQLEVVYSGLGEMKVLAQGVGDLKNVLSNVKTRGILGEIQLENILSQILSPEQYAKNIVTKQGSKDPVEFAIKLPGDENKHVYLPIDAKFPLTDYKILTDAIDSGNTEAIAQSRESLKRKIKSFAKDIHTKYIDVPNTTEFGIMFLPIEGLYAEVVNNVDIVEIIQREYKINIAGPTTMAALLNSLQMGFKTLAIEKRSSEVWNVLGAVKTEFEKFGKTLEGAKVKILQANDELESLIGTRTRQIQRKLKTVTELPEIQSQVVLEIEE